MRRWTLLLAKLTILAIVLFFVGRAMAGQFSEVPWAKIHFRPVWFGLSIGLICGAIFVSTISFSLLFARSGHAPRLSAVCVASWFASLGKYIPGKFAAFASATWLLNRYHVPASVAAGTWILQQAVTTVSGLLLVIPLCFWSPLRERFPLAWLYVSGAVIACLVGMHPRIVGWFINPLLVRLKRQPLCFLPTPGQYVLPVLCCMAGWVLLGLATWLAMYSLSPIPAAMALVFAPAMALAYILGVLAITPGGLVIREAVLLVVLTPLTGPFTAVLAVLMRLLVILAEVIMAGIALLLYRHLARPTSVVTTPLPAELDFA